MIDSKYVSLLSFAVLSAGALYILSKSKKDVKKEENVTVSEIWIYPIKSCAGIKVSSAKVTKRGFKHDRMLMIVDSEGKFVTQRSFPQLSLVKTSIRQSIINGESVDVLTVHTENMNDLNIPLYSKVFGPIFDVTIWGDKCQAFEIIEGSFWFREYLEKEGLKLVRMCEDFTRFTDPEYSIDGETGFSDGFPFLLISQESLADVNKHLSKKITMERFRPNIVSKGGGPYGEDQWKSIVFRGEESVVMKVVKPCSRCTIPNIDPVTGIPDPEREPSTTMKKFRTGAAIGLEKEKWKKQLFLGQNLDHSGQDGGYISVGDIIEVEHFAKEKINKNT